jgi:multiple sugar transport system ATP-binding protein
MNIVKGALDGATFHANGSKIASPVKGKAGRAVFGVRPEDCSIAAPAKADIAGDIYATELLGDHTLVTVKHGDSTVVVKAPKDFTAKEGTRTGVSFTKSRSYVFDAETGARLR